MRERLIKTAAILLALLGFATVQMRAEIPIVQADTVFQGFGGGSVSGIVFGPTGETVIVMHDAQPVEININTKKIVREFEKVPNNIGSGNSPILIKDKNYFTAYVTSTDLFGVKEFGGNVIWDYTTGKIIKALQDIYLLTDGIKYYSRCYSDSYTKEYMGRFDINTFKFIDSIYLPKDLNGYGYAQWETIGVIPNSNKVLVGVRRYTENQQGDKTNLLAELYLVDFDTKKYTQIPIPYETGQNSSEIIDISVSKSGLNNIITIKIGKEFYSFFYDINLNFISKAPYSSIKYNNVAVGFGDNIKFIDDENFISYTWPIGAPKARMILYGIKNKEIKAICDFYSHQNIDIYENIIAISYSQGLTGIIDVKPISVNEPKEIETNMVTYRDSNLVINSTVNERVDLEVVDYNGNMLFKKKDLILHSGLNNVKTNLPLVNGIYFCTLKTNTNSNSYKFIVSR
jgi:hypothetical protein